MQQWHRQSALLRQLRTADRPAGGQRSPYFAHMRLRENGTDQTSCSARRTRPCAAHRSSTGGTRPCRASSTLNRARTEEAIAGRLKTGEWLRGGRLHSAIRTLRRVEAPRADPGRSAVPADGGRVETEPTRLAGGRGRRARARRRRGGHRRLGTDSQGVVRRADKHLPISTDHRPDQFELITRPSSGFVVIRGTAGSGKTTVPSTDRLSRLRRPTVRLVETLFIVFSTALRDYVSHVLPPRCA